MVDKMSLNKIREQSSLATVTLGKPTVLMVGPPTAAQRSLGFQKHILNFRMHIHHKGQWWHIGGHTVNGQLEYWHDWTPRGDEQWNILGLKMDTRQKVQALIRDAVGITGPAPIFIKAERDREMFLELLDWAIQSHERMNADAGITGTDG